VAACGVPVAKMSGRGLGFSGGTLDKLESIPGYRVMLSQDEFREHAGKYGIVLAGQSGNLAPADGKLYARKDNAWADNEAHLGPIVFPATQILSANANTQDDYEEGTWTPIYVPGSGAYGAITYANTTGYYTKIGRQVIIQGTIQTNAFALGSGGSVAGIGGLPFLSASPLAAGAMAGTVHIGYRGAFAASQQQPAGGSIAPNATVISLHTIPAGSSSGAGFLVASMSVGAVAGQNQIRFSATYFTN
jgi:hypothetical protein